MKIEFEDITWDKDNSILRTNAIVEGRPVECRAGFEAILEVTDRAYQSGVEIGSENAERALLIERGRLLRPYFEAKMQARQFDNSAHRTVTLSVDDIIQLSSNSSKTQR